MFRKVVLLGAVATVSSFMETTPAGESKQENPSEAAIVSRHEQSCSALASEDFSAILDAPTQLTEVKMMKVENRVPAFCMVKGYVSPSVGIKLGLPAAWNGKFMEVGCGGHCGVVEGSFSWGCIPAMRKGYACIVSDMGHTGRGDDGLWGYDNLQTKLDWGFRAAHVTALAGKVLVQSFYGSAPHKSYFLGGSTGGREALQEAQRFPWDFDGIVALGPPTNLSAVYLNFAWGIRATHDADGRQLLGHEQLKLLTDAAIAKCDLDDGVKDGIIGDPLHCAFDPSELACRGNVTAACLTPIQVSAVKKVYAGPTTSTGVKISSLGGPLAGSEVGENVIDWEFFYVGRDGKPPAFQQFTTEGFRYLFFLPNVGPGWTLRDIDFDRDYRRMQIMQALYDSSNPDLRKFKAAGGKLLILQGLNDCSVLPRGTIDYYETMERTMGGSKATQSFARLFLVPGADHDGHGVGAGTVDFLSALEAWVEEGKAPDRLIATHFRDSPGWLRAEFPIVPDEIQFTRPLYPYPSRARYKGSGNSNDAVNFVPITR